MSLSKVYLTVYNGVMCAGWATILVKILQHLARGGALADVYPHIAQLLCIFQTGAIAEVLHAMLGLVRSPVMTTLLQVLSRLFILYGTLRIGETGARTAPMFAQMAVAWALSEIVRYAFYTLNLHNKKPATLTWLRYSAFMVLYPLGISGEMACVVAALDYVRKNKPWTVELPNKLNFSFSWYNFLWFSLIAIYPFGSYTMYTYMLSQRRKALQSSKSAAAPAEGAGADKHVKHH